MFRRKKDAEELSCGFEVIFIMCQLYDANVYYFFLDLPRLVYYTRL
jgi:hypothetical protein